jgi:adenylate cyclase 8
MKRVLATVALYAGVNAAGFYTKFLTDRGQRKAFLETHRSLEARIKTQRETERQEKLLLSGKRSKNYLDFSLRLFCSD